jgi:cytidylate kinase
LIVTIDGPAGAGKSSAARRLAQRLGYRFLDTGAMYRAVTVAAMDAGIDWQRPDVLAELAGRLSIELTGDRVLLNGQDVSERIRQTEVTRLSRYAAENPRVREILVHLQRRAAEGGNVVTEGRDQGTVVFPHAQCKVFLTATPEERARRRQLELAARGENVSFEEVLREQRGRDERDRTREASPLARAPDAEELSTDGLSHDEVVRRLEKIVRRRLRSHARSGRSLAARIWYDSLQVLCRVAAVVVLGIRCHGRHHVPRHGPVLLLANHQSQLDPILIGLACNRRLNYVARRTLFRWAPFRWLILSLGAIAIDREGAGSDGLKRILERLRRGEVVLMFPEGTRTRDGGVEPFRGGFLVAARRCPTVLVPVAVDGAFAVLPSTGRWPQPSRVTVRFGRPIGPAAQQRLSDKVLTERIERQVRAMVVRKGAP